MSQSSSDKIYALAGIFQAAHLVHQVATKGDCAQEDLETCIRSLFATEPASALDVYGGELSDIQDGLTVLTSVLSRSVNDGDANVLRYVLNLIQLESMLHRRGDMLDVIGSRIEQARHTASHFGYTHSNLVSNLASIYSDTISTFKLRIQVSGNPSILQRDEMANKVRALLLAGIRSAVLWRQTGGRRWQLIFSRGKVVREARSLAKRASESA
ncbi:high frequency lysogenization protein HflD [Marinobacter sp. F4216]|uniref:high frequency lysogenization protein HflD n=1 Tax=Marinobacter sp. F4216 TaxID=2874281 RepID=UPI001CBC6A9E|nr:high frequency lysogenization protein HflD [Marinobacter sp. F4216]MBZ2167769.1 high frequency lysogenization protein HflD [Marinobacter sp. F4216]